MSRGKIYVNRIVKVAQPLPGAPEGCLNLNCLNFFPNNVYKDVDLETLGFVDSSINLYEVTPYYLKDDQGHIFENVWQGSKAYASVDAQHEVKAGKIIWSHPAEIHIKDGKYTKEFWNWRKKLWSNKYAVRYPNGFHGRRECLFALWYENGEWIKLDYIAARKKIYCKVYANLVQKTEAYQKLKALHDSGQDIQICEMDVRPGLVTEEVLRAELVNTVVPFGHGYVLSACLLGLTHIFDE